jgi:hypothetical protein
VVAVSDGFRKFGEEAAGGADVEGKIIYDGSEMDEDKLRTEIVNLGPEYAALAPKPKQVPCVASK